MIGPEVGGGTRQGLLGGTGINTAGDVELVTRDEGNHSKIVTTGFRRIRSTKTVSKEYSRQKKHKDSSCRCSVIPEDDKIFLFSVLFCIVDLEVSNTAQEYCRTTY